MPTAPLPAPTVAEPPPKEKEKEKEEAATSHKTSPRRCTPLFGSFLSSKHFTRFHQSMINLWSYKKKVFCRCLLAWWSQDARMEGRVNKWDSEKAMFASTESDLLFVLNQGLDTTTWFEMR